MDNIYIINQLMYNPNMTLYLLKVFNLTGINWNSNLTKCNVIFDVFMTLYDAIFNIYSIKNIFKKLIHYY